MRPRLLVAAAIALGVVALISIAFSAIDEPGSGTPVAAQTSVTSVTPAADTTSSAPNARLEFDMSAFLQSKLNGVFGDSDAEIAVVALVPVGSEQALEIRLASATFRELLGIDHVPASELAPAAAAFAASTGTDRIEGSWVGLGLIPHYADSPVQEWVEQLDGIEGVHVVAASFELSPQIPKGWEQLPASLPFNLGRAVVGVVGSDIVTIEGTTTRIIHADGTWTEAAPSPVEVSDGTFVNPPALLPAEQSLVVAAAGMDQAWVLDLDDLTWKSTGPPPAEGFPAGNDRHPLGSAVIDGELVVVTRARSHETSTTVAALDLTTLEWRLIDSAPKAITIGGVTSDGIRLIIAGTTQDFSNTIIGEQEPAAFEYLEDRGWRSLPSVPIRGQAATVTWVEGRGLLGWNYHLESAILDASESWVVLGSVPMGDAECLPVSTAVRSGTVGECGSLAWLDAATLEWHAIPAIESVVARYVTLPTRVVGLLDLARDSTTILVFDLPPAGPGG